MKHFKKIILVVTFITTVLFWQYFLQGYLLLPSVDRFISSFYDQYNHKDFKYIYDVLSHQKIRNHLNPFQFESMMQNTYDKLGPVQKRKRTEWKRTRAKDGVFFLIEYKVKRAKAESVEKFVLIKKNKDWFVFDYVIRTSSISLPNK